MRLAFIVSHPIQYYVPIYRELAELARQRTTGLRDHGTTDLKDEGGIRQTDDGLLTTDDSARISALKVFYTWRDAGPARDVRFEKTFAWDIPLMEGYGFEVVPNTSPEPGTHHRQGLINPDLVARVKAWKPDAVHITGYNYVSHGQAIKELSEAGIPVIFRGDSHLLDGRGPWWRWQLKKWFVSRIYRWPAAFPYVGQANRDYYRALGVPERKLFPVPHTIDVGRFAEPHEELEAKALEWRRELGIPDDHFVFLYAAKLEPRKRPMELLEAFLAADMPKTTLLFVGSGELESALKERAFKRGQGAGPPARRSYGSERDRGQAEEEGALEERAREGESGVCLRAVSPSLGSVEQCLPSAGPHAVSETRLGNASDTEKPKNRTEGRMAVDSPQAKTEPPGAELLARRVVFLPFQNQSVMPVVYRLGDALVLPSGYGETWGLAVNEAQACGRPSLVSDCVGCARDIIREGEDGSVFRTDDWEDCVAKMKRMVDGGWRTKREAIRVGAWGFDTARGVDALLAGLAAASEGTGGRR
jgi:glycosyltransferase involved in cell wall biosynthesis